MVKYGDVIQPKSLLDVGCGTAYLCIAAAHRWPTLNRVELLDIDPLAVVAAKVNLNSDPATHEINQSVYATDFKHYNGKGFDIVLCAPPYLPERPLRVTGIEMATNGTLLLEEVVERSAVMARELWMVFSIIAWPEFQRALARVPRAYSRIEVLRRDVVPFRIPWLEPTDWDREKDPSLFREKVLYYEQVLTTRGLIDMDNHENWYEHLRQYAPNLPENCAAQLSCYVTSDDVEKRLDESERDSRGYRFWHEIRTLRLVTVS
jgi:SAM-dependent methyltransferase